MGYRIKKHDGLFLIEKLADTWLGKRVSPYWAFVEACESFVDADRLLSIYEKGEKS